MNPICMSQTCKAVVKGVKCRRRVKAGEDYCWQHKAPGKSPWVKARWILAFITIFGIVAPIIGFINDTVGLYDRFILPITQPNTNTITPTAEVNGITGISTNKTLNSNKDVENISDIFPFFVGTVWTYNYYEVEQTQPETDDTPKTKIGYFTEEVTSINTGISNDIRIIQISTNGEGYPSGCGGLSPVSGNREKWYVTTSTRFYEACTEEEVNSIIKGILNNTYETTEFIYQPDYLLPLQEGIKWPAFSDLAPRDDDLYHWKVDSKEDIRIPAAKITDCYKLVLYTLPDHKIRWICPGYGLTVEEYFHHPPHVHYRTELVELKIKYSK